MVRASLTSSAPVKSPTLKGGTIGGVNFPFANRTKPRCRPLESLYDPPISPRSLISPGIVERAKSASFKSLLLLDLMPNFVSPFLRLGKTAIEERRDDSYSGIKRSVRQDVTALLRAVRYWPVRISVQKGSVLSKCLSSGMQ